MAEAARQIRLRNLAVRPEALDQVDLPVKIRHGVVGSIVVPGRGMGSSGLRGGRQLAGAGGSVMMRQTKRRL